MKYRYVGVCLGRRGGVCQQGMTQNDENGRKLLYSMIILRDVFCLYKS